MEEELSKPQIKEGNTKISFMAKTEPSEEIMSVEGKEKQGMSSMGIQMQKFVKETITEEKLAEKLKEAKDKLGKARIELEKAEAKFDIARDDLKEFKQFEEDELNRCNPDEDAKIIPIESLKEHEKDCGLCNPDGEGKYLTLEELQERMLLFKQRDREIAEAKMHRDSMLTEEEITKLKRMLKALQDKDALTDEEKEKLQKLIGSQTKQASTSPTIAEVMPSNSIVAPQKDFVKTGEKGVIIDEDEIFETPQEIQEKGKGEKIGLNIEPEFLKAKRRCPKCNAKTKIKTKIIKKEEGKFANIKVRCKNTKRKWYWLWLRKPKCDYFEEYNERID